MPSQKLAKGARPCLTETRVPGQVLAWHPSFRQTGPGTFCAFQKKRASGEALFECGILDLHLEWDFFAGVEFWFWTKILSGEIITV